MSERAGKPPDWLDCHSEGCEQGLGVMAVVIKEQNGLRVQGDQLARNFPCYRNKDADSWAP